MHKHDDGVLKASPLLHFKLDRGENVEVRKVSETHGRR